MNKKVEHIGNQYTSQENKKKQRQKMKMPVETATTICAFLDQPSVLIFIYSPRYFK